MVFNFFTYFINESYLSLNKCSYFCTMILVTGGTGLLGSHLLYQLTENGHSVRALYRDQSKIANVAQLFDYYSNGQTHRFTSIEWVKGDILDLVSLDDALKSVETVYHCAAKVSFRKRDFKQLIHVNRLGTANLVNMSLKFGVKKFGYVSSTAAIGGQEHQLVKESNKWVLSDHTSGYAISKYNAEREVWRGSEEGMEVIIINPCVIFGAGDLNESSLTIFKTVKNGLKFYSPGSNAFVDARDVASCFIKLMESNTANERFLCIGHNMKFEDSIKVIAQEIGVKQPSVCPPKWLAYLLGRINEFFYRIAGRGSAITVESARSAYSNMTYSNEKIQNELNHSFYPFEETVKNVVNFYRNTAGK